MTTNKRELFLSLLVTHPSPGLTLGPGDGTVLMGFLVSSYRSIKPDHKERARRW